MKGRAMIGKDGKVRTFGRGRGAVPLRAAMGLALCALAACGRDAPLDANGARALPPEEAARLLNPLCAGTGGQTHAAGSITTAVTWPASGNPHRVTGTVTVSTGGTLTLPPGIIVCFDQATGLDASGGGRLVAQGTAAMPVVLTARDPVLGWYGVTLQGTPAAASYLTNARVEHASYYSTAVAAYSHPLVIDSTVVRQSGAGVRLEGRASSFARSRVDTTTNRNSAAVTLGDSARFEQSVIRRSAGIGLLIQGTRGMRVLGGRIEGSVGVGITALQSGGIVSATPVRVVGGGSYGIESSVAMLRSLYASASYQDSLKGNARDTVVMWGGSLGATLYVRPGLPWHVKAPITVTGGSLAAGSGTRMVIDPGIGISTSGAGRVYLRGSRTNPAVLTADDPAQGWGGITLNGTNAAASPTYITNARLEHVGYAYTAVATNATHRAIVDSVVIRQAGRAVSLLSTGSRLTRSRVDTTLSSYGPAVELGADAILESTRIRGSSGNGVAIHTATVQVQSCEVRESVGDGIVTDVSLQIQNCNLVNNLGVGIRHLNLVPAPNSSVNGTANWWGDVGGPNAPAGDGVSSLVVYSPWLQTPVVLPYVP